MLVQDSFSKAIKVGTQLNANYKAKITFDFFKHFKQKRNWTINNCFHICLDLRTKLFLN